MWILARGRCRGAGLELSKNLEAVSRVCFYGFCFLDVLEATLSTIMPVQTHSHIFLVADAPVLINQDSEASVVFRSTR